jgi:hypothetical protein
MDGSLASPVAFAAQRLCPCFKQFASPTSVVFLKLNMTPLRLLLAPAACCWRLLPSAKFVTQDLRLHEDRGAAGFVYSVVPSDPHKRGSYIHFCPPALVT